MRHTIIIYNSDYRYYYTNTFDDVGFEVSLMKMKKVFNRFIIHHAVCFVYISGRSFLLFQMRLKPYIRRRR
jgi:hypothetical protein